MTSLSGPGILVRGDLQKVIKEFSYYLIVMHTLYNIILYPFISGGEDPELAKESDEKVVFS